MSRSQLSSNLLRFDEIEDSPTGGELIEGILSDEVSIICGAPYSGKSLLTLNLIGSLVSGQGIGPFAPLGVDHQILWVSADRGGLQETKGRIQEMGIPHDAFRFVQLRRARSADEYRGVKAKWLSDSFKPTVLVIDNLTALYPPGTDINSPTEVGPILEAFVDEAPCPVILLMHTSKAGFHSSGGKTPLGSVVSDAFARTTILVEKSGRGDDRVISIRSNNRPESRHKVTMNPQIGYIEKVERAEKSVKRNRSETRMADGRKWAELVVISAPPEVKVSWAKAGEWLYLNHKISTSTIGAVAKLKRQVQAAGLLVLTNGQLTAGPNYRTANEQTNP
jgi:hypothetical protein